jgi:hypothetical protein
MIYETIFQNFQLASMYTDTIVDVERRGMSFDDAVTKNFPGSNASLNHFIKESIECILGFEASNKKVVSAHESFIPLLFIFGIDSYDGPILPVKDHCIFVEWKTNLKSNYPDRPGDYLEVEGAFMAPITSSSPEALVKELSKRMQMIRIWVSFRDIGAPTLFAKTTIPMKFNSGALSEFTDFGDDRKSQLRGFFDTHAHYVDPRLEDYSNDLFEYILRLCMVAGIYSDLTH